MLLYKEWLLRRLDSVLIGGILLITGTSIGGAMLALPLATASNSLPTAALSLLASWLIMTLGALFLLEVNLWCPSGSNLVSMAGKTLGKPGRVIAWVSYLFLLYTLLSAYISGGSDVLQAMVHGFGLTLSSTASAFLWVLLLGVVVYRGVRLVDYTNRFLMFAKLGIFFLLVFVILPKVHVVNFIHPHSQFLGGAFMVLITSFGFASIIPSLREYFNDDAPRLRRAVLIGSLIPLVCYLLWLLAIMGAVPQDALYVLSLSEHATTGLSEALGVSTHQPIISSFFSSFSTVCMLTAFLGVSLGLFDFLADGLKLKKQGKDGVKVFLCTFLPPFLIVLFAPGVYLKALSYAGILCVILLLLLPSIMVYRGRYHLGLSAGNWSVAGGKATLSFTTVVSIALIVVALTHL